jgi:hypothetical protein
MIGEISAGVKFVYSRVLVCQIERRVVNGSDFT